MIEPPMDHDIRIRLEPQDVRLLADVIAVLARLGSPDDDAGAARLVPSAYPRDDAADAEWATYAVVELDAARRSDRSAFEVIFDRLLAQVEELGVGKDVGKESEDPSDPGQDLDRVGLVSIDVSRPEAEAILRVVNDARLVLAARWGVETSIDMEGLDDSQAATLDFLSGFQFALTRAVSTFLDEP